MGERRWLLHVVHVYCWLAERKGNQPIKVWSPWSSKVFLRNKRRKRAEVHVKSGHWNTETKMVWLFHVCALWVQSVGRGVETGRVRSVADNRADRCRQQQRQLQARRRVQDDHLRQHGERPADQCGAGEDRHVCHAFRQQWRVVSQSRQWRWHRWTRSFLLRQTHFQVQSTVCIDAFHFIALSVNCMLDSVMSSVNSLLFILIIWIPKIFWFKMTNLLRNLMCLQNLMLMAL